MDLRSVNYHDALAIMDQRDGRGVPIPFRISFVTLDRNRRTGGQLKTLDAVIRCGARHSLIRSRQIAVKRVDGNGHPYPIHLRLITRINGEPVQ